MQLLFLLFSSYFASLFCLYLNTRYADLKVPFEMMGHIFGFGANTNIERWQLHPPTLKLDSLSYPYLRWYFLVIAKDDLTISCIQSFCCKNKQFGGL